MLFWLYAGFLLWLAALTDALPAGSSLAVPPYASFVADWPLAGLGVLSIALAVGWLAGRRRLVPVTNPSPEERLAGYTVALTWLGVVAVVIGLTKPYALVFVLPSLYAWLWLPLRTQVRARASMYALGLTGPVAGLLVLAHELGLGPLDTALYFAGLATVGYVSLWSVLLMLAWASAAAQLATLAFGRYAPYAGGIEPPPPGIVRSYVTRLTRALPRG